jgi:predicted dinucleotide-binding enzyme
MNIAIIGAGNVGGSLARAWSSKHTIFLGVRDPSNPDKQELGKLPNTTVTKNADAVSRADVIVIAVHPPQLREVCESLGNISGKIIIDANNSIRERVADFPDNSAAIAAWTNGAKVVKCFNTAGANIIGHADFGEIKADTYMAGDNVQAKETVNSLAQDAGFARAVDCGKLANAAWLEKLADVWVGLVINSGLGREFAFKMLQR